MYFKPVLSVTIVLILAAHWVENCIAKCAIGQFKNINFKFSEKLNSVLHGEHLANLTKCQRRGTLKSKAALSSHSLNSTFMTLLVPFRMTDKKFEAAVRDAEGQAKEMPGTGAENTLMAAMKQTTKCRDLIRPALDRSHFKDSVKLCILFRAISEPAQ
ncbi:hypothetical protein K439DRAFT_1612023 [Ramaria rubella]|nr:hypothetical protein K439DRAFT_1612023 [Ramaria rubella]